MIDNVSLAFSVLMGIMLLIFYTSGLKTPFWQRFYAIIPAIILCCFMPATLNTLGFFAGKTASQPAIGTQIYGFSANYLLPAALFLMTISMDLPKLIKLGWKLIFIFFAASFCIIISGPIALWIYQMINPEAFADDTLWRSFSAVAGSWIGGAANQAAMKELFHVKDNLFGVMILVDTTNASLWLFVIFIMAKKATKIDRWLKADTRAIDSLIKAVDNYEEQHNQPANLRDFMLIIGLTFFITGIGKFIGLHIADFFQSYEWSKTYSLDNAFFWMVLIITLFGVLLSFTPVRKLDEKGASKLGTVAIYILIAAIGMQIDLRGIFEYWQLLLVGTLWMALHVIILLFITKLIRAPIFYLCVASNANTGGASSAPIVATAFHPALAPVGILLGIMGYVIGTVGGYICTLLMHAAVS